MHSNKYRKSRLFALKSLSAAVVSSLLFSSAYAAGLGKMTVLSALGQPLRAEIELTAVSKEEAGGLVAKLASAETYRRANVDLNAALLSLRFAVQQRGDRHFIRVTSGQPLNEPFVEMLLELGGPNGRLIREYTFLLDPPALRSSAPPQAASPAVSATRQPSAAAPAPRERAAGGQQPTVAVLPGDQPAATRAQEYQVQPGETLAKIANQLRPAGVSLDQMLVALYRRNPDAFTGNNMNRLRAGEILSLPSASEARAIPPAEARSLILAQSSDFNQYRSQLAGQVEGATAQKSPDSGRAAGGRITARVEEPANAVNESRDKLRLSSPGTGDSAGLQDRIAQEKALAEANSRIKELEASLNELRKLLEVKSSSLAPAGPEQAASDVKAPAPVEQTAPASGAEPGTASAPQPSAAAAPSSQPPTAQAAASQQSILADVADHPLVLPGAALLLGALGAFGLYSARRRRQEKEFHDSVAADTALQANSLFGVAGGQNVDTSNSLFNSNYVAGASQLGTNEVDALAEADVYIAYGRDAQAEEILKEALRARPERHALRVKLLEIYAQRKDVRAFEAMATELHGLTGGEGEEWQQALALARIVDPQNPLYGGASEPASPASSSSLLSPTQALSQPGLPTLLASTQSDSVAEMETAFQADDKYFSTTALVSESTILPDPAEPLPVAEPMQPPVAAEPDPKDGTSVGNELDFDLNGMDFETVMPDDGPEVQPAAFVADANNIDFELQTIASDAAGFSGFSALDDAPQAAEELVVPQTPADMADEPLGMEQDGGVGNASSGSEQTDGSVQMPSLDFDLSGITLDFENESVANPSLYAQEEGGLGRLETTTTLETEMATKLELAIAYQEIGDKEGARELLDEVIRGGTAEQSRKAQSLLVELV